MTDSETAMRGFDKGMSANAHTTFLICADTNNSQDSRERDKSIFVPLYHFFLLRNIHKFICNFACEMTTTYF